MAESTMYNRGYVILIAAVAAVGGLLFGYNEGVIAGALLLVKNDPGLLIGGMTVLPVRTQEWIVSIMVLGAAAGALGSGRITDKLGRKRILIIVFKTITTDMSKGTDTIGNDDLRCAAA